MTISGREKITHRSTAHLRAPVSLQIGEILSLEIAWPQHHGELSASICVEGHIQA